MSKDQSNLDAKRQQRNLRTWLHGFETSRMRHRLFLALGHRVRLGSKAKIILALVIFFIAFSVRALTAVDLAPILETSSQPLSTMSLGFHYEALGVLKGDGILIRDEWDSTNTSLLTHSPGYGIYLSVIYKLFGPDYFTVQFVQDLLNSLASVLIFLIAGRLLSWPVGIVAGLIAAIWHHFAYYSNIIMPDSPCVLPTLAAVYLLVVTERGKHRAWWAYGLAGLLIGLSVWIRPNTLMLGVFIAIALPLISIRRRQTARRSWLIAVISLLVIAPITIRNYILYQEFVPVSINTGIVMWEGIADIGGERFGAVNSDLEVAQQEAIIYDNPSYGKTWSWPDGIKRDRDRVGKCLKIIADNPFWFARGMVWRVGQMFRYSADAPLVFRNSDAGFKETGEEARQTGGRKRNDAPEPPPINELSKIPIVAYGESISRTRPVARLLQRIAKETALPFILIGLLMIFFMGLRRGLYVLMVPLYYFVFQSVLHTEFRYTLPLHHYMFIFSAAIWVLIGSVVINGARRIARPNRIISPTAAKGDYVRPH
jgi:hypothetical protein